MARIEIPDTCGGHYDFASTCHPIVLVDFALLVVDTGVVMPCFDTPLFPEFLSHFFGVGSGERIYNPGVVGVMCFYEACHVLNEVLLQAWFLAHRIV